MTVDGALKILSELLDEYKQKKRIAVAKENYIYYNGSINALIKANKRILKKNQVKKIKAIKQQVGSVKPLTASYAQRLRELKASDIRSVRGGF